MVTVGGAILLAVATATVVKSQESTAVKDAISEANADSLRQAPENVAEVQPTQSPDARPKIKHLRENDTLTRTVGRNVTFRDLIAEAYDCGPGNVVLPLDAPAGGFDFLVTVSPQTRKHLREAIKKELGYTATAETRDTEVLVLQVKDPSLPGLTASTANDDDIVYRDGKLYFIRQPMSMVVKGLEDGLAEPVLDKTGLTNNYDFSLDWSEKTTQAIRDGTFQLDRVEKALGSWGLELKTDTARVEMFTVKKVN